MLPLRRRWLPIAFAVVGLCLVTAGLAAHHPRPAPTPTPLTVPPAPRVSIWQPDGTEKRVGVNDDPLVRQIDAGLQDLDSHYRGRVMPCGDPWGHVGDLASPVPGPLVHYCTRGHRFIETQGTFVPYNGPKN